MHRLLHCDDAADYRALVDTVLGATEDFDLVGQAVHGRDCLDRVEEVSPDVVLLDLAMPLMDGFEALPGLRERVPDAALVVLTTTPSPEVQERALALGATAVLEKPRNVLDLPVVLREILDGRASSPTPSDVVEELVRRWREGDAAGVDRVLADGVTFPASERGDEIRPIALLERGDQVVVLAHARLGWEHRPVAWRCRVADGRVAEVARHNDWQAAQAEAGIAEDVPHLERSLLAV